MALTEKTLFPDKTRIARDKAVERLWATFKLEAGKMHTDWTTGSDTIDRLLRGLLEQYK